MTQARVFGMNPGIFKKTTSWIGFCGCHFISGPCISRTGKLWGPSIGRKRTNYSCLRSYPKAVPGEQLGSGAARRHLGNFLALGKAQSPNPASPGGGVCGGGVAGWSIRRNFGTSWPFPAVFLGFDILSWFIVGGVPFRKGSEDSPGDQPQTNATRKVRPTPALQI